MPTTIRHEQIQNIYETSIAGSIAKRWPSGTLLAVNHITSITSTATSWWTRNLTVASTKHQLFTGTLTHTCVLPDATTLYWWTEYIVNNISTGIITINIYWGTNLSTVGSNKAKLFINLINTNLVSSWKVVDYDPPTGWWLSDGDYWDITVSWSGTVMIVDDPTLKKSETSVNNSPLFTTIEKFNTLQTNYYANGTVALETTLHTEWTGCMKLTLSTSGVCWPRLALSWATNLLKKSFTIKVRASVWANISTAEILFATEAGFSNYYLWQWKGASNPKLNAPPDAEWIERVFNPWDCMVGSGTPNWWGITHIIIRGQASTWTPDLYVDDFKFFNCTQKPMVCVTFDDGLLSQYTLGKAKLDQYDIRATFYVIHNELTPWTNMETSHHNILSKQWHDIWGHWGTNLTTLTHDQRITDLRAMKKYLLPYRGNNHYALPNGGYNDATLLDVQLYFNSIANIDWLSNTKEYSPNYLINRFSPDSGTSTATIQAWIDNAIANNNSCMITFHWIVASGATGAQVTQATYDTIMDYIGTKKTLWVLDTGTLTDYYARPITSYQAMSPVSLLSIF